MMGLVYKDFLVMRKQLSYYLIFVVLYAGLTVAGVFTPFILPGIVVLVGMMLPMSLSLIHIWPSRAPGRRSPGPSPGRR